jgi:hypothetical protein
MRSPKIAFMCDTHLCTTTKTIHVRMHATIHSSCFLYLSYLRYMHIPYARIPLYSLKPINTNDVN